MKQTQEMRILNALRGKPRETTYFTDALRIMQYGARILGLRGKGYVIEAENLGGSLWRYTLVSEPDKPKVKSFVPPPALMPHTQHETPVFGCRECIRVTA